MGNEHLLCSFAFITGAHRGAKSATNCQALLLDGLSGRGLVWSSDIGGPSQDTRHTEIIGNCDADNSSLANSAGIFVVNLLALAGVTTGRPARRHDPAR